MKTRTIKKQEEFQKLFSKGKRSFSPSLTVVYLKSDELKMGISVGKRHGKAHQRNRIKRLLREAFRLEKEKITGKYSIVLMPKVCENYSLDTFRKHFSKIVEKEKL